VRCAQLDERWRRPDGSPSSRTMRAGHCALERTKAARAVQERQRSRFHQSRASNSLAQVFLMTQSMRLIAATYSKSLVIHWRSIGMYFGHCRAPPCHWPRTETRWKLLQVANSLIPAPRFQSRCALTFRFLSGERAGNNDPRNEPSLFWGSTCAAIGARPLSRHPRASATFGARQPYGIDSFGPAR